MFDPVTQPWLVYKGYLNIEEANNVLFLLEDLRTDYRTKPLSVLAQNRKSAVQYLAEIGTLNPATVATGKESFVHEVGQALSEIVTLCNKRLPKHPLERKSVIPPSVRRGR